MTEIICNNIGTFLNLIGTIMIAFSIGPFPGDGGGFTTTDSGSEKRIAYFNYPWLFWGGMFILGLGFLFQFEL